MVKIFFKTIWNNRRRNILVFIELFVISLVLVNLTLSLVNMITIARIRNCYDTHNVVLVSLFKKGSEDESVTLKTFSNLKMRFSSDSLVESISISTHAVPYNYSLYSTDFKHDSEHIQIAMRQVDINYSKVMKITPLKGRWFNETDIGKAVIPIIISRDIEEKYFSGNSIGENIKEKNNSYEIIGVVDHFKRNDTEKPPSFGFLFQPEPRKKDWDLQLLIRTKEGKTGDILNVAESYVYSTMDTKIWTIKSLNSLENMRESQNNMLAQVYYLILLIVLFIMINVFLGIIGILWYNTNLRINEFGIKRALGETGKGIFWILLAENMFLGGLGLLIVILIFIQAPILLDQGQTLPGVFIKTFWISVITMICLVFLSTWIPASLASKIHPAAALKTE